MSNAEVNGPTIIVMMVQSICESLGQYFKMILGLSEAVGPEISLDVS